MSRILQAISEFIGFILIVATFLFIVTILTSTDKVSQESDPIIQALQFESGQRIAIVPQQKLAVWMENHSKCEIVSITTSDKDPNGILFADNQYFVIIFK